MPINRTLDNQQQGVVRDWLGGILPALVELYDCFGHAIADEAIPGRARIIAHCIREIRSVMLGELVGRAGPQLQYPAELRTIVEEVELETAIPAAAAPDSSGPSLLDVAPPLGAKATERFWNLVKRSGITSGDVRDVIVELFRKLRIASEGIEAGLGPIAADFKKVSETHGVAHSRETDAELLTPKFVETLNKFDGYLYSFATSKQFVEALEPLDAILEDTNQPAG